MTQTKRPPENPARFKATLLYGAHDERHNQAVVLRDWLAAKR